MSFMSMRMGPGSRRNTAWDPLADRLMVSFTFAPLNCMTSSIPLPPSTASLPWPGFHTKKSLPFPRKTASVPRPASTRSSPFPPMITSLPSPALIVSLPFSPATVNVLLASTPEASVNWSSPLPSVTEMALKSARLKRCSGVGSEGDPYLRRVGAERDNVGAVGASDGERVVRDERRADVLGGGRRRDEAWPGGHEADGQRGSSSQAESTRAAISESAHRGVPLCSGRPVVDSVRRAVRRRLESGSRSQSVVARTGTRGYPDLVDRVHPV